MIIRLSSADDAGLLADYYRANAGHFGRWDPIRPQDYYDEATIRQRYVDYEQQHLHGTAAYFIGVRDGHVIAHCSLTNIIYGPFRAGFIGYGVSQALEGTGCMRQLCQAVIEHAFEVLELNRVMANYMPANKRSGFLLQKLGFTEEGYAKKYLKINGRWEDHILTALVNPQTC
jgi:[ribosomal protein S5]-alanine N-acetyltransferase